MLERLLSKRSLGLGLVFGVLFYGFLGLFLGYGWSTLMTALISALLYGFVMARFVESQNQRMVSPNQVFEREEVLKEDSANLGINGGFLTLTPTRLVFRSHGMNFNNRGFDIPLTNISKAKPSLTFGLVPNGLIIQRGDGKSERLVVWGRKDWATLINQTLKNKPS